jgi:hypothetical protein
MKREVLIDDRVKPALDRAIWWGIAIGMSAGLGFGIMLGLQFAQ